MQAISLGIHSKAEDLKDVGNDKVFKYGVSPLSPSVRAAATTGEVLMPVLKTRYAQSLTDACGGLALLRLLLASSLTPFPLNY